MISTHSITNHTETKTQNNLFTILCAIYINVTQFKRIDKLNIFIDSRIPYYEYIAF